MKRIEVVAAIIYNNQKLFAAQRGYGQWKGYYEFPGGKVEQGETKEAALIREIQEELDTTIEVNSFVKTVEYDYPDFHLTMHCYMCRVLQGNLTLLEHEDAKWLSIDQLHSVPWLPADEVLFEDIKAYVAQK